jgi:hypothetical protein
MQSGRVANPLSVGPTAGVFTLLPYGLSPLPHCCLATGSCREVAPATKVTSPSGSRDAKVVSDSSESGTSLARSYNLNVRETAKRLQRSGAVC